MKFAKITVLSAAVFLAWQAGAQKITRAEYIERYKDVAVAHQEKYGIPASIKMAQGILESGDGNSRLAVEANNHFGIKCKSGWEGEKIHHDDDAPGECFRAYATAAESWDDHSEFLDKGARYQFLFDFAPTDYKAWAQGLKDAGYATNPKYPELLIRIIEENRLYLLDGGERVEGAYRPEGGGRRDFNPLTGELVDPDRYTVALYDKGGYGIYINNGVRFVVAREGNELSTIGRALGVSVNRLRRVNDLGPEDDVAAGNAVYLEAKNRRAMNGDVLHTVKEGETLHSLSQLHAIKVKRLARMNNLPTNDRSFWFEPLLPGQLIKL